MAVVGFVVRCVTRIRKSVFFLEINYSFYTWYISKIWGIDQEWTWDFLRKMMILKNFLLKVRSVVFYNGHAYLQR